MPSVLPFAHGQAFIQETPTPANYREGIQYLRLNLTDDAYERAGYREGAVFIAQADLVVDGRLHYVELADYGFLAHLTEEHGGLYLMPLDGFTTPGCYARADMSFIGAVIETYPQGLDGARWLLDLSDGLQAARFILRAVAN